MRCNPFSHGGVDELADRRLFRDRRVHDHEAHA
jgi:putative component of membrane protein insertase Oxa1/YidC/SpoIIIJ protein YidD